MPKWFAKPNNINKNTLKLRRKYDIISIENGKVGNSLSCSNPMDGYKLYFDFFPERVDIYAAAW